jgi:ferric-dicitrate binding protein FerR (iron transport regulator)
MGWDEAGDAAGGTRRPDAMQAVAPRATYGTPAGTDASRPAASWRRRARVFAGGALAAAAVALLCLGLPGLPDASELEDVVSKPVRGPPPRLCLPSSTIARS